MDQNEVRMRNLRAVVTTMGGVSKVAKSLGYVNPSFISQMIGPSPTRAITEKTARKFERDLGLTKGALDDAAGVSEASMPTSPPARTRARDDEEVRRELLELVEEVIELVGRTCEEVGAAPGPAKFGALLKMGLEDAAEHGGHPRAARIRNLAELLK